MNDYAISNLLTIVSNIESYASYAKVRGDEWVYWEKLEAAKNSVQELVDYLKKCEQH